MVNERGLKKKEGEKTYTTMKKEGAGNERDRERKSAGIRGRARTTSGEE